MKLKKQDIQDFLLEARPHILRQSLDEANEAMKDMCGMLNSDAAKGFLLFGIDENKNILGIEMKHLDSAQRHLKRRILRFSPPIFPIIKTWVMDEDKDIYLIQISAERKRDISLYDYDGKAYIYEESKTRQLDSGEKMRIIQQRKRELHPGPWKCNRCNSITDKISKITLNEWGIQRSYACSCGGELFPLT